MTRSLGDDEKGVQTVDTPGGEQRAPVTRRLPALIILVLVGVFGASGSAHAWSPCGKDAPPPLSPKSGLSGLLTLPPEEPAVGDPFTNPDVALHHVYGTSWAWSTYDLGCAEALTDSGATINTMSGNLILGGAAAAVAVMDLLERFATTSGVDWFAGWIGSVTDAVRPVIMGGPISGVAFVGLLPLAIIIAGIWLVWRAKRADLSEAARAALIGAACIGLAVFALAAPGVMSRGLDEAVQTTAEVSGSAFSGSLTDGVNRSAMYRAWSAGMFGDADSAVAREYGPRLFKATHYSWAEWAQVQGDPDARKALDDEKADAFKDAAREIKDSHPAAYEHLKGHGERAGVALFAWIPLLAMGLFVVIAFGVILVARIVMQMIVIVAPIAAVAGMLPKGGGQLLSLWDMFVAALVAVVKFTLAAGAMTLLLGALSGLDPVTAILWMAVASIAALKILKPARTMKAIMPGMDPSREYLREFADKVRGMASGAAVGAGTAGPAGAAVGAVAAAGPERSGPPAGLGRGDAPERVVLTARPPLPPPVRPEIEPVQGAPVKALPGPPPPTAPVRELPGPPPAPPARESMQAATPPVSLPPQERPTSAPEPVRSGPVIERPAPAAAVSAPVVIVGEVIESGTYRRPATEPTKTVPLVDVSRVRDRGTDQPANEITLYRSNRKELVSA